MTEIFEFTYKPKKLIRITLGGDVMIGRAFNNIFSKNKYFNIWGNIKSHLLKSDLFIINLETTLTDNIKSKISKTFNYRLSPKYKNILKKANVKICSLANNHILDYGIKGMEDTFKNLDILKIKYTGAGIYLNKAQKLVKIKIKGYTIGFLSAADHYKEWAASNKFYGIWHIDYSNEKSINDAIKIVRRSKRQVDVLIFSCHMQSNYVKVINPETIKFYRLLIDNGVDVVHGHSPHHVLPIEKYKKGIICYSLGDLIDDYAVDETFRNDLGIVIDVFFDGKTIDYKYKPTKIEHIFKDQFYFKVNFLLKESEDSLFVSRQIENIKQLKIRMKKNRIECKGKKDIFEYVYNPKYLNQIEADGKKRKGKKRKEIIILPLDCLGEITTFLSSSKIFFNLYVLSKRVKNYYDFDHWSTMNIDFFCIGEPIRRKKKEFVKKLILDKDINFKLSNYFETITYLDLGENINITSEGIKDLTNLTHLDLGYNDYITDKGIKKLTKLKWLEINGCLDISSKGIKNLTELTHLNIGENRIIADKGIKNLTKLTYLDLGENIDRNKNYPSDITDEGIKDLTKLTYLKLRDNENITDKGIKILTKLVHLNLGYNKNITDEGIKNLTKLIHLDLGWNNNKNITDEGIKNLTKLTHLELGFNNNKITDEGIKYLTKLNHLDLGYNDYITDKGIKNLTTLIYLDLERNESITDEGIKDLTKLTHLDLGYNENITDKEIKNLTKLTHLDLGFNKNITDKGIKNLTKLTYLDLYYNKNITSEGIKDLTNLVHLNLGKNNKITSVNDLIYLLRLYLGKNTQIDDKGIRGLNRLDYLNLGHNNKITNKGIYGLPKLRVLDGETRYKTIKVYELLKVLPKLIITK